MEHGDQDGRDGDSGRCLRPRCSWLDPVPVYALAVRCGAVRGAGQGQRPPAVAGQVAVGEAQDDGLFGAQRAVVQAAEERRQSGTDPGQGGSAVPVGAENLCHQAVFMNHASGAVAAMDPELIEVGDAIGQRAQRRGLLQGAVRPVGVVEGLVVAQDDHRMFFIGYFAGIPVAVILAGIALWRSQAIPRWLPVLFVVALLAGVLAPPGIVPVPLSLPFVIVMMLLARRIWGTAPER